MMFQITYSKKFQSCFVIAGTFRDVSECFRRISRLSGTFHDIPRVRGVSEYLRGVLRIFKLLQGRSRVCQEDSR